MARDQLKDSICETVGLPLLRVRWGEWDALSALDGLLEPHSIDFSGNALSPSQLP
jgi:hypothetical protein